MDQTSHLRLFWWAAALTGAVLFATGFFPAFEIQLGAIVGGGDSQKTYDYIRSWSLASYGTPLSIAALLMSAAVVGSSLLGLSRRGNLAALATVTVLALGLSAFTTSAGFRNDYDRGGAEDCSSWSDCGGPFLNPGVRRIQRDAAKRPEAKLKEYDFESAYTARSFLPWKVLEYGSFALLCVGGFLLFRSVPLLVSAGPGFGPISVLAASGWATRLNCAGGLSTAEASEGRLALYLVLFGLLSGVAALTVKRRKLGALTLVITLLTGLYAFFVVGFACENS